MITVIIRITMYRNDIENVTKNSDNDKTDKIIIETITVESNTKKYTKVSIVDFDEIWYKYSFRKNIWRIFSLSIIIDVKRVKTTLKVEDLKFWQKSQKLPKILIFV